MAEPRMDDSEELKREHVVSLLRTDIDLGTRYRTTIGMTRRRPSSQATRCFDLMESLNSFESMLEQARREFRMLPRWFIRIAGLLFGVALLQACVRNGPIAAPPTLMERVTPQSILSPTPTLALTLASETPRIAIPSAGTNDRSNDSEEGNASLFDLLIKPLEQEALRRRSERASKDPEWGKRVDLKLNKGRVNVLLFGYGYPENYSPNTSAFTPEGSPTILSLDLQGRRVDVVSLTHDIRAPEIERASAQPPQEVRAIKIDQAYAIGKFELMRRTVEDATGLSVDFQVAFDETVIRDLVDQVFGGVEVEVPRGFEGIPVYIDGIGYPARFAKGQQWLTGTQVLVFIKAVPVVPAGKYYGKDLEHNVRKGIVFEALLQTLKERSADPGFWGRLVWFITAEEARFWDRRMDYDFDPIALAVDNIRHLLPHLGEITEAREIGFPEIRKRIYVQDPANGDGGVGWVSWQARRYPQVKKDVELGVYPPRGEGFAAPVGGNPYGENLVTDYWPSVRILVKQALISPR
jgi:hypothetical protein